MMNKKIPWEDYPKYYAPDKKKYQDNQVVKVPEVVERNFQNDLKAIGTRIMFGAVTGSIIGAAIGTVDVLRDVKAMSASPKVATQKVLRFSGTFGCFFASYHGLRKSLHLYYPQPMEDNILMSAFASLTPLVVVGKLRPTLPYAVMLIVIDCINGFNDV